MSLRRRLPEVGRVAAMGVCATVVAVAGCGSNSGKRATRGSAPVARNAIASAPPAQILSDAAAAVRAAHSYAMQGTLASGGQSLHIRLLETGPGAADFTIGQGPTSVEMIELAKHTYVRANAAFWKLHGSSLGSVLAGRWIQVPQASLRQETSILDEFAPGTLARCLAENHGTLTRAGTTRVDGRPAVVIRDAGNVPGGAPGLLAVASTGAPDPLRVTSTGRQRPGGRVDVCNTGKATDVRGTLTFSRFGTVPAIRPPAKVVSGGKGSTVV